ncbi:hypothetical protein ACVWZL_006900 [Bradyrhizobium sp. GM2.4]
MLQRAERLMPADVAVQDPGAVVTGDPVVDEPVGRFDRTVLEHRMQHGVHGMGILPAQLEAALGDTAAATDIAVLGHRPAVHGEEPPILAIVMRDALAQLLPGAVVIGHAGEREQAEGAERQRQHQCIARPRLDVLHRRRDCLGQPALN